MDKFFFTYFLCLKEEFDMDDTKSNLTKKIPGSIVDFLMQILSLKNLACLKEVCIYMCFIVCVVLRRYQRIYCRNRS